MATSSAIIATADGDLDCAGVLADPGRLTLRAAIAGIRDRRFSAVDLMRAYFALIHRSEDAIHAWAWIDEDRALACAREADRLLATGSAIGPLHGVPVAVKDIIYTAGIATGMGSPIYAGFTPTHSATCVKRLLDAGAIVQGKTITAEFATRHPGPTANPWNTSFTPGGSSSGSAAAVAAGFTAAALGTQTVGSIIRPAVYCGVVGYKPSFGLIPRFGVHAVSETLDQVGVLARTVDDAALLAAVMVGPDPRDSASVDAVTPIELDGLGTLPTPPRIAAIRSPFWPSADSDQQALFESNCAALRAQGASLEYVDLPPRFDDAAHVIRVIQAAEAAVNFKAMMECDADRTSSEFRALFERGTRIGSADYAAARAARTSMVMELDHLFDSYDVVATPPATGEPPRTLASTGSADFCAIWTLCGAPCVAFPTGLGPQSMPMGLQIVGKRFDDRRVLQVADWCMQRLPFPFHPEVR